MSDLLPQHAALLKASAISDEVAQDRGYRSVEQKARLTELGFSANQARVPALLIPLWDVHAQRVLWQARADEPRFVGGKAVKYETPAGSRMVLDVPPAARSRLGDPTVPLFVTEGVRKADAAVSVHLCCVALIGVWNWRGTNDTGGTTALAAWESIALNERTVYIVFDSDVMTKVAVHQALVRLKAFLEGRKARVHLVYLPSGPAGTKTGLDDYLAAGHTVDELLALATSEVRGPPAGDGAPAIPYRQTPTGIVWDRPTQNGQVTTPLTNFRATIAAQVVEDDGVEQRRMLDIEGAIGGWPRRFRLSASAFVSMNWATEHLGANAVTYAGMGLRDHARVAIQLTSGQVPERVVHTHTGWREVDGAWVYLHGGGAIGPLGTVAKGVETRLEGALARYLLPDPPVGDALRDAVRASLRLLDVAPDRISVPLLAATYRAPVGPTDHSLFLVGPTGVLKTELAALIQQHFGAGMDSRNLPGSWSSTGNLLEALAFVAKDAILVIDDFAPTGSGTDVQRYHRDADRVLRAQGNASGRGRMRADTTFRPAKPPRGLILSTGEDVPRGHSLRARILVVGVDPGDVDEANLSDRQAEAAAGDYASSMAGYLAWFAPRYGSVQASLRAEVVRLRADAQASRAHRRTPDIVANLIIGIDQLLAFARDVGAIGADERATLRQRCWDALGEAAADQAAHQAASEPASRFLELLVSAIASGRAHVADPDGESPESPSAWGWRARTEGSGGFEHRVWRSEGQRVGWLQGPDLFLDPEAAFAAAQAMGRGVDDGLTIGSRTLHQRLKDKGLLVSVDGGRDRLLVRRTLDGRRRSVLHLEATSLDDHQRPAQTARTAHDQHEHPQDGPFVWSVPADPPGGTAQPPARRTAHTEQPWGPDGPSGPDGTVRGPRHARPSDNEVPRRAQGSFAWEIPPAPPDASGTDDWGTIE